MNVEVSPSPQLSFRHALKSDAAAIAVLVNSAYRGGGFTLGAAERIVANLVSNALAHTPECSRVEVIVAALRALPTAERRAVVEAAPALRALADDVPQRARSMFRS